MMHQYLLAAILLLVMTLPGSTQEPIRATPFGYYEGSAVYGAEFMKQSRHMAMELKAKADFWFVAERTGPKSASLRGEGIATYDFAFGVDWGAVGPGVDLINVMGLKISPDVKIILDPKTSVHKFSLSGQMAFGDGYDNPTLTMELAFKPTPPGKDAKPDAKPTPAKLVLSMKATVRATGSSGPTFQKIEIDPHNPLGTVGVVPLKKRAEFGPHAVEVESDAGSSNEAVFSRRWHAVQKIDYGLLRRLAEREGRNR